MICVKGEAWAVKPMLEGGQSSVPFMQTSRERECCVLKAPAGLGLRVWSV